MPLHEMTICPKGAHSRRRRGVKTRSFGAQLMGALCADSLWELGRSSERTRRPVWLAYFATTGATRAFTMNLRSGRPAELSTRDRLEVPKSSDHRWVSRPVPGGVITVAYLPELFHLDPPVPFADDARFVFAPSRRWIDRQAGHLASEFGADSRETARAALFAAYLDRRTSLPLLRDLRFHLEIYRAAREEPWLTTDLFDRDALPCDLDLCGLDQPLICSVDSEALSAFLTRHTRDFHRRFPQAAPVPRPTLLVDDQFLLFAPPPGEGSESG